MHFIEVERYSERGGTKGCGQRLAVNWLAHMGVGEGGAIARRSQTVGHRVLVLAGGACGVYTPVSMP